MSFITPEQISAANKTNIESILTLANATFASVEKLATLNLNTARSLLEDSVSNTKALMGAKDMQELVSLQSSMAQPSIEKIVSYGRSVYEITSSIQEEASKIVEGQVSEANKNLSAALDKAAKSAPAGSDVAVAAVKSAIAAASSAYDSMSKAAKQVVELTEANVTAATDATVKAVSSTTAAKGKKTA